MRVTGIDQHYSGLEARIERGIPHFRSIQDTHVDDKEAWICLMIGARNTFNKGNMKIMV